jgi:GNAT superfamily N-acetyltransferase
MSADATQAQVHPLAADLEALLAPKGARGDVPNLIQMRARDLHTSIIVGGRRPGNTVNHSNVRVSYLELTQEPAPVPVPLGQERISKEIMAVDEYLELYRRVGEPLRWDQRLKMPVAELQRLLRSAASQLYVLKGASGEALGFCEFERGELQEVELKNFGLVPTAYGRGLGPWLLLTALHQEWAWHPRRIWLHTDNWDHPAAAHVYQSAGFRTYMVKDQPPGDL